MAKFQRAVPRVKPPLLDINPVLVCLHCVVAVLCMDDAIKYELSLSLPLRLARPVHGPGLTVFGLLPTQTSKNLLVCCGLV